MILISQWQRLVLADVFEIIHVVKTLLLYRRELVLAHHLLSRLVVVTVGAISAEVWLPNLRLTVHRIHASVSKTGALAQLTLHRRALALSARLPVVSIFVGPDYWIVAISFYTLEALLAIDALSGVSKVHLDACWPIRA